MEISKLNGISVKIKGKLASIIIDPLGKAEAEIVIATQDLDSLELSKVEGVRLVISGPGEYEVGGISISSKQLKTGVSYLILDSAKILFITSNELNEISDDEEFDAVLIKVVSPFSEDALGPIHTKCTVLYGNTELAAIKSEDSERATKINLKKTAEIQGKIFILG